LDIKEPSLVNLALGAKIVWRLISGSNNWWKEVLHKKYFSINRLQCIDGNIENKKGSHILKLFKVIAPLIQDKIKWVLGKEKLISI